MNAFISEESQLTYKWINREFFGEWIVGSTAGGCGNDDVKDYWKNPQFCVSLSLLNQQGYFRKLF
jgi:hypothetical protein